MTLRVTSSLAAQGSKVLKIFCFCFSGTKGFSFSINILFVYGLFFRWTYSPFYESRWTLLKTENNLISYRNFLSENVDSLAACSRVRLFQFSSSSLEIFLQRKPKGFKLVGTRAKVRIHRFSFLQNFGNLRFLSATRIDNIAHDISRSDWPRARHSKYVRRNLEPAAHEIQLPCKNYRFYCHIINLIVSRTGDIP